jgi:hypothetical protein
MCLVKSSPVFPGPVITWTTPLGIPAFSIKGASAREANGVFSEGLMIMTFPVTNAGATL